jgi:hypothetical protein
MKIFWRVVLIIYVLVLSMLAGFFFMIIKEMIEKKIA